MARKRVTRQELNRRRLGRGFVGRADKLSLFRDNLDRNPQDEDFQYIFHVGGNAGVGKTSLVRQWESAAHARDAVTVYLDDDVHSPLEAMEAVSVQLERQGLPLRAFQEQLATYRQRRHEVDTTPLVEAAAGPPAGQPSMTSSVMAQAGLAGLGMLPVPGAGALAGVLDPQQMAQRLDNSAERLRAVVAARLRTHDDVRLVVSPVQVLTPVFLQDLEKAADRRPWLVLFFDVFERTGPLLNEWLRDLLVGEEYGELPLNVLAVLSGQGRLDERCWSDHKGLVCEVPLEVFTDAEARDLLSAQGITDEPLIEVILRLSGRLPVLLDMLAQAGPRNPDDIEDPADTAVDRFLKWITDPARRDVALTCALPLQLDEDVYRAAVPEAAADAYAWLRGLPFVTGHGGRARYHDVVRAPMLRLQRARSSVRWQQQHLHLADVHRRWAEERDAAFPASAASSGFPASPASATAGSGWPDPDRHEHRLSEMYHRLCGNPATGWPEAVPELVRACDQGIPVLRRWAQIVAQAGRDAENRGLVAWGERLLAAADDEADGTVTALTQLIGVPELDPAERALAHTVRGREYRTAGRYDQALADYAAALRLAPDLGRAHYGRGETLRLTRRYDEALASLTRAIELDPDDAVDVEARARTYQAMGRHEQALADFDRAIELDPDDPWTTAERGESHRVIGNFDLALADFDRAVELDPGHIWAITIRAQTHRHMGAYDLALADHDRAIALDPEHAWVVANRGETHRLAGDHDKALADLDRAIELDPEDSWIITNRGETHRAVGRHTAALADFDRAIALNPAADWAVTCRARTYQALGRHDEALADFDRSLELDPDSDWSLANRGEAHRAAQHYDLALADLDRALVVNPDYAWAVTIRAQTHRHMGAYDLALADHDRGVALDPGDPWALTSRGQTHQAMGDHEAALADYGLALEADPDYAWALGNRGETLSTMHRFSEALADFTRSLALDPENTWATTKRGELLMTMRRYDEALADFDRALELEPDSDWSLANRAEAHHSAGRHLQALADFDRALALSPDYAWALSNRAQTLKDLSEFERALADHDRALAIDPDNGWAYGCRAETYRALGRYDEALADLDRGLALEADGWFHCERALTLHQSGKPGETEAWLAARDSFSDELTRTFPRDVWARGNLTVVRCALGEWDEAAAELGRLMDSGPTLAWIREVRSDLAEFAAVLDLPAECLEPLRRTLDEAAAALSPGSAT